MAGFNKTFADSDDDESCSLFVSKSLEDHMLQHYVVALHKCVMSKLGVKMEGKLFEDFKSTLNSMYSDEIPNNKVLARFLKYYTRETYKAYNVENGHTMFQHMRFRDKYNIKSNMKQLQIVNAVLCQELCKERPEDYCAEMNAKGAPRDKLVTNFLNAYIPALIELRILMYSESFWHLLKRGCFYITVKDLKYKNLPAVTSWLGSDDRIAKIVLSRIMEVAEDFAVADTDLLTRNNEFLISTQVGVFNSITGLYSANTRFLRYYRYRKTAVWPHHDVEPTGAVTIYPEINENLLDYQETVGEFVHYLRNNVHLIFLHFIFAPAMFQLTNAKTVVEDRTDDFIRLLAEFVPKMIPDAFFVAECFSIDERVIYTMLHLMKKRPEEFMVFLKYEKLVQLALGPNSDLDTTELEPAATRWKEWYESVLHPTFSYDREAESYMDRVRSIRGVNVNAREEDDETLFTVVMLAVVLLKRRDFKAFACAFGYTNCTVKLEKEMPEAYARDFDYSVSPSAFKSNLERAKLILFPEEKLQIPFIEALVNTMFSVCMSTYFNQERVRDTLNILSALYVMHNQHKKLFVLYGEQNTGKSSFVKYIDHMASPQCCTQPNLKEHVRTGLGGANNVVILNEMEELNFNIVKMISGNDIVCFRKLYTQEFARFDKQALIYACSNTVPINRSEDRKVYNTDQASIDRFHAVKFVGSHVARDVHFSSVFHMMMNMTMYESHSSEINETAVCINWMAFMNYFMYRNEETFFIPLELNSQDNVSYQEMIRYTNNKLYQFLFNCGLRSEKEFNISYEDFISIVERYFTWQRSEQQQESEEPSLAMLPVFAASSRRRRPQQENYGMSKRVKTGISNMAEFKQQFFEGCGVDLRLEPNIIRNHHCAKVIDHIKRNMSVVHKPDGVITDEDIEKQLSVYSDRNIITNALDYFSRTNINFRCDDETHRGIVFKYEPIGLVHFLNTSARITQPEVRPQIRVMNRELLENAASGDTVV